MPTNQMQEVIELTLPWGIEQVTGMFGNESNELDAMLITQSLCDELKDQLSQAEISLAEKDLEILKAKRSVKQAPATVAHTPVECDHSGLELEIKSLGTKLEAMTIAVEIAENKAKSIEISASCHIDDMKSLKKSNVALTESLDEESALNIELTKTNEALEGKLKLYEIGCAKNRDDLDVVNRKYQAQCSDISKLTDKLAGESLRFNEKYIKKSKKLVDRISTLELELATANKLLVDHDEILGQTIEAQENLRRKSDKMNTQAEDAEMLLAQGAADIQMLNYELAKTTYAYDLVTAKISAYKSKVGDLHLLSLDSANYQKGAAHLIKDGLDARYPVFLYQHASGFVQPVFVRDGRLSVADNDVMHEDMLDNHDAFYAGATVHKCSELSSAIRLGYAKAERDAGYTMLSANTISMIETVGCFLRKSKALRGEHVGLLQGIQSSVFDYRRCKKKFLKNATLLPAIKSKVG